MDPLDYGWKDTNGHYAPGWFSGPAMPDYLFHEGNVMGEMSEDSENDHPDLTTEFDDAYSEPPWSDDSGKQSCECSGVLVVYIIVYDLRPMCPIGLYD